MKQTAVEWLEEQLNPDMKTMQGNIIQDLLEQAKEMEKEQIIDAHNHGFTEGTCFGASPISYKFIESEQYYKQTFKTKDQWNKQQLNGWKNN